MATETSLRDRLQGDLTEAIRARDQVRVAAIRMVLAGIATEQAAGAQARQLSDDDVVRVITREAKKRREAAEAFDGAGRPERAAAERAELGVLEEYLPPALSDEELAGLVADAIAESGASGPSGMGAAMKVLGPRTAGRAEGSRVAAEVRRQLAG